MSSMRCSTRESNSGLSHSDVFKPPTMIAAGTIQGSVAKMKPSIEGHTTSMVAMTPTTRGLRFRAPSPLRISVRRALGRNRAARLACRRSPACRDLGHEPDGRTLEVVALERFAVTEAARLHLDCLHVLRLVAIVGNELRAAVAAVHFERALGSRRPAFVAADS
jgi:hypothetical protein